MTNRWIRTYLSQHPEKPVVFAAQELGVPERDVLRQVENGAVTEVAGQHFSTVMEKAAQWGALTLIVANNTAIIEVGVTIPRGSYTGTFYNLHEAGNPLGGHIRPDRVDSIFFVSRPFMGKESHSVQFFDHQGFCAFKIYLGRDENGNILKEQLAHFIELKQRCEQ